MVGDEEGDGRFCPVVQGLRCPSEWLCKRPPGTCFYERGDKPLEDQPRPDDGDAKDQAGTEADPEARLYDAKTSGAISLEGATRPASRKVLLDWMVHWFAPLSHYGIKVVDD